jgi:hypothetical protein
MRMKVVGLAAFRAGDEYAHALQRSITPKRQLAETHRAHAAYVYAQQCSWAASSLRQRIQWHV